MQVSNKNFPNDPTEKMNKFTRIHDFHKINKRMTNMVDPKLSSDLFVKQTGKMVLTGALGCISKC